MKLVKLFLSVLLIFSLVIVLPFSYASPSNSNVSSNIKFDKMYYSLSIDAVLKPILLTTAGKPIAIKSIQVLNGQDIVKVESSNIIKPLKLGYAMISATATNGEKAETSINVYEGLVCQTYKIALTVGETFNLNLQSKNLKPLVTELTASATDPSIATIEPNGTITAIAPGETDVNIGNNQESLMIHVGVFAPEDPNKVPYLNLDNLNLQLFNTYLPTGNFLEASATKPAYPILNDGSIMIQFGQVKITSSDPSILMVVNKGYEYNVIYAKKAGTAKLTISANGLNKDFPVTVKAEPKIKSISVIKKDAAYVPVTLDRIKIGLDLFLALKVNYQDGTTRELIGSYEGVTWKSSNPSIASVGEHSMKGLKVGDVTITATYRGINTNFKMKIIAK
jgi:hypothetical protein